MPDSGQHRRRRGQRAIRCLQIGVVTAAAVLSWVSWSAGQEPLRVNVNLVNVFATVEDPDGGPVTDLTAADFRIYEDGVEQRIDVFERNGVDSVIGILVDSSGGSVDVLPYVRTGLLEFARTFPELSRVFVVTFASRIRLIHELGEPFSNLEAELRDTTAWGTTPLFDALLLSMQELAGLPEPRKALIVFTDGNDNASRAGFGAVNLEAQRSGVLLYFIPIGARVHVDQRTIESLASQSGGRAVYLEKSSPVLPALDTIRNELGRQYYLGYYAQPGSGFRTIRVEIPGRDVRIRAKTGYLSN